MFIKILDYLIRNIFISTQKTAFFAHFYSIPVESALNEHRRRNIRSLAQCPDLPGIELPLAPENF